jgi:FlaA1/EpsC-like NDP-sugar epimerase
VALFDSDTTVIGRKLQNLRVHDIAALADLVQETGTRQVLIAEPGLSRAVRRTLLEKFTEQAVTVKIAPAANEIADGTYLPSSIRDIKIEDLLGRDPVPPQEALVHKSVAQKSVMITGAGGSIGSELSLQCLRGGATTLVLLDHSEFALFEIQREIEAEISGREDVRVIAALEDVNSTDALRVLMRHYRVDVIFHAAAYKHVRMLQENPEVGIRNNIEGTRSVAQAAVDCGVSSFVLISTDKAVRPTSVMGATKRVSEMIVQSLSDLPYCKTLFCMVRFGNVLGSTGSVVPIFRDQIAKGGPVTVTHPDVTRYFMLIPEAAQLVVQAASIAKSGEVLVLDMGEPVRVSQLAHAMVELAGSTVKSNENPDGDIEIKYIGLREGEKMHEELEIGNDLTPTLHPRILRSKEFKLPRAKLDAQLKLLNGMLNKHQRQKAIALLMELAFKH